MNLNQRHITLLGALRRIKRPTRRGVIVAGAAGTTMASTKQFDAALSELIAGGQVKTHDGWVLPIKEN